VVEECLVGPEVSFFVLCDGVRGLPIGSAQDHKRALDGDQGPNTGGMGALAPSPLVDDALITRVMQTIVAPVLTGMRNEGNPFAGILYCGLMLTSDGPKVIEFNVRFGDPEAQVVLPLLPVELTPLLMAAAAGQLPTAALPRPSGTRVGVVLASGGYPGAMQVDFPIEGLEDAGALDGILVFHAGTRVRDDAVVTAGGRVVTVVGEGPTLEAARARAYDAVARISFRDMHFRKDIAARSV
jgi:phosphoribosylamine--glycine ligase